MPPSFSLAHDSTEMLLQTLDQNPILRFRRITLRHDYEIPLRQLLAPEHFPTQALEPISGRRAFVDPFGDSESKTGIIAGAEPRQNRKVPIGGTNRSCEHPTELCRLG
jgi:hypothetical protein